MAVKKKGGGGDEGGSWMDTYGDLVTLLLTFFVLLYSMSSVDKQKWDLFVRSIYPDGKTPSERAAEEKAESEAEIVINTQVTDNTPMADEMKPAFPASRYRVDRAILSLSSRIKPSSMATVLPLPKPV